MGYGDITSASDLERGFAIVGMIIGATVFGYIIGNVAVIMENFNVTDAIENGKMNQIKEWLYDRKVRKYQKRVPLVGRLFEFVSVSFDNRTPAPDHGQS